MSKKFIAESSSDVIEADSLLSDELNDEINIERVFEADSLLIRVYYMHVAELVLIASITFNNTLCFCLSHSIELVLISVYRV